ENVTRAEERVTGRAEGRVALEIRERSAVGQQERGAAGDIEHAERRDERCDVETSDQDAVDEPDDGAERKGDQDDLGDVKKHRIAKPKVDAVQDEAASHHAAETDDRADRQVDPPGN